VLLAGCTATGSGGPNRSAEPLPTGLVGPVAPTVGPDALRYVALGDSYTFGDGVTQADRWPNQLVRILRPDLDLDIAANLAGRSTASQDVIEDQLPRLVDLEPQFVSVQVGVNDAIAANTVTAANYSDNMATILDTVLGEVDADRVVVLTTPDYTLTPQGAIFDDPEGRSARTREFNALLRDAARSRGIAVVDISPISDRVPLDPTLVAPDGLHPSGKQYAGWADLVAETVRKLFREAPTASGGSPAASAGDSPEASTGDLSPSVSP